MRVRPSNVPLENGWSLWPEVSLRGAGFPVELALSMASAPLAEQAEREGIESSEYVQRYENHSRESSNWCRELAIDPTFRLAIAWQNPSVVRNTLDRLLATVEGATDADTRRRELVCWQYLFRYATKNESIGFFGPWGWAHLKDSTELRPGQTLIKRRQVFLEYWAVRALADSIASREEIRQWLPVRLHPACSPNEIENVSVLDQELLRTCQDAEVSVNEAIEKVAYGTGNPPELVRQALSRLEASRHVIIELAVPTHVFPPPKCLNFMDDLQRRLGLLPPNEASIKAMGEVERLAAAFRALDSCATDQQLLDKSGKLDLLFQQIAQTSPRRGEGKTYAGRTLVYEDCVRDLTLHLGPEVIARFAPPLSLILTSARWFTWRVGEVFRTELQRIFATLSPNGSPISYNKFWQAAEPLFAGSQHGDERVSAIVGELHGKWASILNLNSNSPEPYMSGSLKQQVDQAFAAPCPGWPTARYHSPDLLLSASSVKQLGDENAFAVLGEIHTGVNTLAKPVMFFNADDAETLISRVEEEIPFPRVARPETADSYMTQRLGHCSYSKHDYQIFSGRTMGFRSSERQLRVADLKVEQRDGQLWVVAPHASFEAGSFFEEHLRFKSTTRFSLVPSFSKSAKFSPRITIDGLVVSHARWRFPTTELEFVNHKTAAARFAGAQKFRSRNDLPRFVFVKTPEERKPLYLDFFHPGAVEVISRFIRASTSVSIAEMLPTPESCWLTDSTNKRYTCELRFAAVDPVGFRLDALSRKAIP